VRTRRQPARVQRACARARCVRKLRERCAAPALCQRLVVPPVRPPWRRKRRDGARAVRAAARWGMGAVRTGRVRAAGSFAISYLSRAARCWRAPCRDCSGACDASS